MLTPNDYMLIALEEARYAAELGEIPVGAVIVDPIRNKILARNGNRVLRDKDPTAHAEILVIREVANLFNTVNLQNFELFVTLEPCSMCASAIAMSRIKRLEFGAYDPKPGGVEHGAKIFSHSSCHHKPEVVGGVRESESAEQMRKFFAKLR